MPTRTLREGILTSDRVNRLGVHAELFYRRLMSVVDDYGRFDARPSVLRVACYPLKVDATREADISRFLTEVQEAGLIALYAVNGKPYLEMRDFNQRTRAKFSKFPAPTGEKCPAYDGQMPDTCPTDGGHMRTETKTETIYGDGGGVDVDSPPTPSRGKAQNQKFNPSVNTPNIQDVKKVAEGFGLSFSDTEAQEFLDWHVARGWQVNGSKILDWRPRVRAWKERGRDMKAGAKKPNQQAQRIRAEDYKEDF